MSKVMDIEGRQYYLLTRALMSKDIGGRQNPVVKRFLGQAVLTRALVSQDIGGRQYVFLTRALVSMDIGGRQNPVV